MERSEAPKIIHIQMKWVCVYSIHTHTHTHTHTHIYTYIYMVIW